MPRRQRRSRRLATAARWPLGIALTSWRYMWRTTPMHRTDEPLPPGEQPPPFPEGVTLSEVQHLEDGVGAVFHRLYRTRIRDAPGSAEGLIGELQNDPDRVAPSEFASFKKVHGEEGRMQAGDEFVVRMPGPWDGPVRVADVTPTSFRLVTLQGHLEAGQIEFRAQSEGDLIFCIESWARSGDRLSDLLYDRLRMSKEVQLHMWTSFLERVVQLSEGRMTGGVEIRTRRRADG